MFRLRTQTLQKGKHVGSYRNQMVLFLLPSLVLLAIFTYYPFFSALSWSLYRWDGIPGGYMEFIGLANFAEAFQDRSFWKSFLNLAILLVTNIIKSVTIPLLVAELIFHVMNRRLAYAYRVAFVLPMIVPAIVGILIWGDFLGGQYGLINQLTQETLIPFLRTLGLTIGDDGMLYLGSVTVETAEGALRTIPRTIDLTPNWLADTRTALAAIIIMGFPWAGGIAVLIYLAGLMNIPEEVRDSAIVDGASGWKRFWNIDVPYVRGQIKLIIVLTLIATMQGFDIQLLLTDGGPGDATLVPALHMYHYGFVYGRLGYASALAVILFVVMLVGTGLNMRFLKSSAED